MAFRKPKQQPRFADLIGILAQSKETENPLYQTVQEIINRLTQFQGVTLEEIADINASINNIKSLINNIADKDATYLTTEDETLKLPNSVMLLAGEGIAFDDTVPNQRTISSSGLCRYYDAPLMDGNIVDPGFIFGLGECIIVQVPNA